MENKENEEGKEVAKVEPEKKATKSKKEVSKAKKDVKLQ